MHIALHDPWYELFSVTTYVYVIYTCLYHVTCCIDIDCIHALLILHIYYTILHRMIIITVILSLETIALVRTTLASYNKVVYKGVQ